MTGNKRENVKLKVLTGLAWTFGERIIAQGVSFVLSVVLARILMPDEYGIIAMVMVFINIANVFVTGGVGEALVQKKDADENDYSTMFYVAMLISLSVYAVLFFSSPYIGKFYDNNQIVWVLRVLSLKIVVAAVSTIQHAYVQKHMLFKKFFLSTISGTIVSGIVGISMALNGFGVWSLVFQYLINTMIDVVILFFTVPWRPKLMFSREVASGLMCFGGKMIVANLINAIYNEMRSLVIGKTYSTSDLAYYNKGNQIPSLAITNIDTAIGSVLFPAMSMAQTSEELKRIGRKSMQITSYIIFPLMIGLIVVAEPILTILLTEKWRESILYMQILCVYWMTQPIQTMNWQIIKAMGRSDICLKLEVIKKTIGIGMLLIAMPCGLKIIALSAALSGLVSMFVNMWPNKKMIGYSIWEQIRDILPAFILSIIMGSVVYLCSYINVGLFVRLIIQIVVGIVVYIVLSFGLRVDAFIYIAQMLKKIIKGKRA